MLKVIIYVLLILLLIGLGAFAVWQGILFVKDIIKKVKAKKIKNAVNNPSADESDGRKEDIK